MIRTFADERLELLIAEDANSKTKSIPSDIHRLVVRKIAYLNQARRIEDLKVPPGNRLKKLK